jgi:hypothetical protein
MQLFYSDGKSSIWEPGWPRQYNHRMARDLGEGMPTTFGRTDNVRDGVSGRSPNRQFLAPVGILAGAL